MPTVVYGQRVLIKGTVVDKFTREPMAYASIHWKLAGTGDVTDTAGRFKLHSSSEPHDSLMVSFVGYETIAIPESVWDREDVYIEIEPKTIKEVVIKSKTSKGVIWWRNIVKHKPENSPRNFNSYYCQLYNKQEIDINNFEQFAVKKALKPFEGVIRKNVDSTSESVPFLPVFLTESMSDYYSSSDPNKTRQDIKAINTSGIRNESVMGYLEGQNQKINSYDEYILLFGKEFISPTSKVGDRYYEYRGADTQEINGQKYYHLFFEPKRSGENVFRGDLWIHASTWAIQKINLNVSSTANLNYVQRLTVIQEFQQLGDKGWAVSRDKFVVELSPFSKSDKLSFIGRKTSTYHNIQVNQPFITEALKRNKAKDIVNFDDSSKLRDKEYWAETRPEALSTNEQKIYKMVDTITSMPAYKRLSDGIVLIFDGHKKYGPIEIGPWYKWFSSNQQEGLRLRFDLGTTREFNENLRLHGYMAYGVKDGRFKGGADANYKMGDGWSVFGAYIHDLDNGRNRSNESTDVDATTDNMFSRLLRRDHIPQKFLGIDAKVVKLTKEWPNHFSVTGGFSHTSYETFNPLPNHKDLITKPDASKIVNAEPSIRLRYAPGEKDLVGFRRTRHVRSFLPVFEVQYAQGLKGIAGSNYAYNKVTGSINQKVRLPRWGQIDYTIYGGKIFGDQLPFMLLEVHPGNEIYYYNKKTFNLMNRFEYASDRWAGINIEHNVGKKFINLLPFMRKVPISQFWNVKTVWGDMSTSNKLFNHVELGGYHLKALNGQFYTEIGTGFDNIFKYFRIDAVWRFAPPVTTPVGNNTTKQNFGIFGSFQLSF